MKTEWGSYLFFDDDVLIGFGGFKGPPHDDAVEIGYAVAPSCKAAALRTTVLERCGFERTTTIPDPDDAVAEPVWRWERPLRT